MKTFLALGAFAAQIALATTEGRAHYYEPVDITGTRTADRACALLLAGGELPAGETPRVFAVEGILGSHDRRALAKDAHPTLRQLVWDLYFARRRAGIEDRSVLDVLGGNRGDDLEPIGAEFYLEAPQSPIAATEVALDELRIAVRAGDREYRVAIRRGPAAQSDFPLGFVDRATTYGRNPKPFPQTWVWMLEDVLAVPPTLLTATDRSPHAAAIDPSGIPVAVRQRIDAYTPEPYDSDPDSGRWARWLEPLYFALRNHDDERIGYVVVHDFEETTEETQQRREPYRPAPGTRGPDIHRRIEVARLFQHFTVDGHRVEAWRPGALPPLPPAVPVAGSQIRLRTTYFAPGGAPKATEGTQHDDDVSFLPNGYWPESWSGDRIVSAVDWSRKPAQLASLWRWQIFPEASLRASASPWRRDDESPLVLSRGGRYVIVPDASPVLVDTHTGARLRQYDGLPPMTAGAFASDQRSFYVGHADGSLHQVPLDGGPRKTFTAPLLAGTSLDTMVLLGKDSLRVEATDADGNRRARRLRFDGDSLVAEELPDVWEHKPRRVPQQLTIADSHGRRRSVTLTPDMALPPAVAEFLAQLAEPLAPTRFADGRNLWPISPSGYLFADRNAVYRHGPDGPVPVLYGSFRPGFLWGTGRLSDSGEAYILEYSGMTGYPAVIHRLEDGVAARKYSLPGYGGDAFALAPNGRFAAVGKHDRLEIVEYGAARPSQVFYGDFRRSHLQFSADGASLLVVDEHGQLRNIHSPRTF